MVQDSNNEDIEFNLFEATNAFLIYKFLMIQEILNKLKISIDIDNIIEGLSNFEDISTLKNIVKKWKDIETKIEKIISDDNAEQYLELLIELNSVNILINDLVGNSKKNHFQKLTEKLEQNNNNEKDMDFDIFMDKAKKFGIDFYIENIFQIQKLVKINSEFLPKEFIEVLDSSLEITTFTEVIESEKILFNFLFLIDLNNSKMKNEKFQKLIYYLIANNTMVSLLDFYQTNFDEYYQ